MTKVVGIKFYNSPKIYYFDPLDFEYKRGQGVVVETQRGLEYGTVSILPTDMDDKDITGTLKPVVRLATQEDAAKAEEHKTRRHEFIRLATEKVKNRNLSMKIVDTAYTLDESKMLITFTAPSRVDFRELVRDLASAFRCRIELHQVNSRDEVRIKGAMGVCGRECCCSDCLGTLPHVSIKMAKTQSLSLKPTNISGMCGRLMCCLEYENATYNAINKTMPNIGASVTTSDKKSGIVVGINQLKEIVRLKISDGDSYTFEDYPLAQISFKGKTLSDVTADDMDDEEIKNLID